MPVANCKSVKFMIRDVHCNCRFKLVVYLFARLQKQLNVPKQDKMGVDLKRINAGKSLASLAHFQKVLLK